MADVARSFAFYEQTLGLREVWRGPAMAILELRGGTHLLLFQGQPTPGPAGFDLMTGDVPGFAAALRGRGAAVGPIGRHERSGHDLFEVTDPDGHVLTVYSDHTEGRPV